MPPKGRLNGLVGPWRLIWFSIQGNSPSAASASARMLISEPVTVHYEVLVEYLRKDGIVALFRPQRIRDVASARVLVEACNVSPAPNLTNPAK